MPSGQPDAYVLPGRGLSLWRWDCAIRPPLTHGHCTETRQARCCSCDVVRLASHAAATQFFSAFQGARSTAVAASWPGRCRAGESRAAAFACEAFQSLRQVGTSPSGAGRRPGFPSLPHRGTVGTALSGAVAPSKPRQSAPKRDVTFAKTAAASGSFRDGAACTGAASAGLLRWRYRGALGAERARGSGRRVLAGVGAA